MNLLVGYIKKNSFFKRLSRLNLIARNSCAGSPCGTFECLVSPNFSNGYICACGFNDYRTSCSCKYSPF